MKKVIIFLIVIGAIYLLGKSYFDNKKIPGDITACTMDAMACPDGSFVGRTGPSCEFETCPLVVEKPTVLCYSYSKKVGNLTDKTDLILSITGDKVTGQLKDIPAQKDSKIGEFSGTVGVLDPSIMGRKITAWWDVSAEGMTNREELIIQFGEGSASVAYGEIIKGGEDTYVYKDINKVKYGPTLSEISCDSGTTQQPEQV